jgi:hypothetical protein
MVKWKEEGMWTCEDPTCAKSNFDEREECVQGKLPKSKFVNKKCDLFVAVFDIVLELVCPWITSCN